MQVDTRRPTAAPNAPHAQGRQAALDALPELGLYLPAGQKTHAALELPPVLGLNEPAGQFKQKALLSAPCVALYLPASQGLHRMGNAELQLPTAQQIPAPALLKTPEAQAWHVEAPAALKKLAPQLSQSEKDRAPCVSLYRPTGQAVQDAVP